MAQSICLAERIAISNADTPILCASEQSCANLSKKSMTAVAWHRRTLGHPARREHRLGPLHWPRSENSLRTDSLIPLAKLSRLRNRRRRRFVRSPFFGETTFITGAIGPNRVYATGGLRFWKDGRDVPDVLLGLYDYPKTDRHPAFNLSLRVNFVDGAGESSGFRFIGSEGIMTVDGGVTVTKQPRQSEPGVTTGTFAQATAEQFMREYREKYPPRRANADSMRPQGEQRFYPPSGYNDSADHHRNFLEAVRSQKPVVEDATFGFRAAGPALLSNVSFFEQRMCEWNPESMSETKKG